MTQSFLREGSTVHWKKTTGSPCHVSPGLHPMKSFFVCVLLLICIPFDVINHNCDNSISSFPSFWVFSGKSWDLRIVLRIPHILPQWHYDTIIWGKEKEKRNNEAFHLGRDNLLSVDYWTRSCASCTQKS